MSTADDRADSAAAAAALAPLLPGWSVATDLPEDAYWSALVRADGARIRIRSGGWGLEGRLEFIGCWPRYRDGREYYHGKRISITCDGKRSPGSLAKDVLRRLLPAYELEFAKALAYVTDRDQRDGEGAQVAQRLATVIGGTVGENRTPRGDGIAIHGEPSCVSRLAVHPAYGNPSDDYGQPVRVDFQVHGLDPETAAEVLQVLQRAEEQKRGRLPTRVAPETVVADEISLEESDDNVRPVAAAVAS